MCVMNVALPLPNPDDWLSTAEACSRLVVTRRTLERWGEPTENGVPILRRYTVAGGPAYWRAEVDALVSARRLLGQQPPA